METKYEKALARAREGRPMEEIFPELREAEDERIIQMLENTLRDAVLHERISETAYREMSAYLEKQKENPKSADSIPADCASDAKCENEHNKPGDFVFELRQIISRHWYADIYSECVDDEEGMAREILSLCEKQKEQKSLTTEEIELNSIAFLEQLGYTCIPPGAAQKGQKSIPSREMILGIWELGNIWKANSEKREGLTQLQYIQKYWNEKNDYLKEQKPAEGSEEDKETIEKLHRLLIICRGEKKFIQEADYNKMDNLLKSLRPQYHGDVTMTEAYKMGLEAGKASSWKPSEEQMDALDYAIAEWDGGKKLEGLYSLRNELKKLM